MVKFYPGVAGALGYKPSGIVFHNDSGSQNANAAFYRNWLPQHEASLGFAHDYVASDGTYHAEDYGNKAWHTANANGNANYIGIEICQSLGDEKIFRNNEQKAFQLGAKICKMYGWTPSPSLFPLHKEFSSTDCPHRTWALHGQSINAIRQYYADGVAKYMDGSSVPPTPETPPTPSPSPSVEAWNKKQSVDVDGLQIRTSQTSASASIGSLNKGQTFNATRIARNGQNVNGYSTWFEVNGRGWVSGAYVTEVKSSSSNGVSASGSFTVKSVTNIRSGASTSASIVGQYKAGQSFNYDRYVDAEGYRWYSYVSYSGARRYVADVGGSSSSGSSIKGSNLPNSGTYKFTTETKIRYAAGLNGAFSGSTYKAGQSVKYNSKVVKDGYVWLVYTGGSGRTCYVAVV